MNGDLKMSSSDFKKNYLQEIIFKVDFRNISDLIGTDANPDKFVNIIKKEFNKSKGIAQQNKVELSVENPEIENIEQNNIWAYTTKDESKFIELSMNHIAISYDGTKYKTHKELINDIELIIEVLKEYGVPTVNKIGLRYINEISPKIEISNWDKWINPKLHNFNPINTNLELMRALTQSEYQINGYNLDFTYGQFNLNYPNTEINNDFVLDYDCYTSSLTEIEDLIKIFKEMHNIIKLLFMDSIEEYLIKDLKGEL